MSYLTLRSMNSDSQTNPNHLYFPITQYTCGFIKQETTNIHQASSPLTVSLKSNLEITVHGSLMLQKPARLYPISAYITVSRNRLQTKTPCLDDSKLYCCLSGEILKQDIQYFRYLDGPQYFVQNNKQCWVCSGVFRLQTLHNDESVKIKQTKYWS